MATITKISALARSVTGGTPHRWIIDFNDHEVGAESHIHKFYVNPHVGDEPFSACCQTCFKQYSIKIDSPNSRCNGLTHHLHTVFGTNLVDVECCRCDTKIYAQVEKPTLPLSLIRTLESNRGPNAKDVPDFPIAISALIKFFDDALDSNSTSVYGKGNSMTFDLGLDSTSKEIFDIAGFTLVDDWLHAPELNQASKQTLRSIIFQLRLVAGQDDPSEIEGVFHPLNTTILEKLGVVEYPTHAGKTHLNFYDEVTRLRETDVGACFGELGCLSDMNDEWILEAFQTQVSHSPSSACGLVDSLMKIRARRTEALDQEIASKRSQGIVCTSELEDAYRAFDIPDSGKNVTDEVLLGVLRASPLEFENLRIVLKHRSNPLLNTLTGTPSDTPEPDTSTTLLGATPVGIGNIGSTCYLNSVIQYVYTVKDIREAVINMDPNDKYFLGLWKAVNGRILYKTKIIEAKEVALELRELFLEMRSAKDKEVKPSRRLVNLLFPPLSFPDEESPRRNPAYEQQDISETITTLLDHLSAALQPIQLTPDSKPFDSFNCLFYLKAYQKRHGLNKKTGQEEERCVPYNCSTLILPVPADDSGMEDLVDDYFNAHEPPSSEPSFPQTTGAKETPTGNNSSNNSLIIVSHMPPILQVHLMRTVYDKKAEEARKTSSFVSIPKRLYLDEYLDENESGEGQRRYKKIKLWREERRANQKILRSLRKASKPNVPSPASILDVSSPAPSETESLSPPPSSSSDGASSGKEVTPECRETDSSSTSSDETSFKSATEYPRIDSSLPSPDEASFKEATAEDEIDFQVEAIRKLTQDIEEESRVLARSEYRLHTIFHHDGNAYGGHYWVYILDNLGSEPRWIKYSDGEVSVIRVRREDEVFKGIEGSTAVFCVYVRASDSDKVQTVHRVIQ